MLRGLCRSSDADAMLIIPELQIEGGKLVARVSPDKENIVHDLAPMDAVRRFEAHGAERLHVLDVDAALGRDDTNEDLIRKIIASTHIPVQVAGGMRTAHHIEWWFEAGAAHAVLGTLAITDQSLLAEVSTRYPAAILANIATKDGYVMIDSWRTQTAFRPQDIVYDLQMAGVAGIIHFDINRRIGDAAASLALTMEMAQDVVIPVYSSGTVHDLDGVARLRDLPDIKGVIIGEALISGTFELEEALEVDAQREISPGTPSESSGAVLRFQRGMQIYLAAYSLSPAARWWNRELRQAVTLNNPYVEVLIPHEDLEIDPDTLSARELQAAYEAAIDGSDAVVVVLDGVENEAWTGFECGYARAKGKYLLGVATRVENAARRRFEAMCDEVVYVDADEDPYALFTAIARELNSKLLMDYARA